jgi:hypothetical protein
MRYLAEHDPRWRLVIDSTPPKATKLILRTLHGGAIIGDWYEEGGFVAWMPLPKYSPEQRRKLDATVAAGLDVTQLQAVLSDS